MEKVKVFLNENKEWGIILYEDGTSALINYKEFGEDLKKKYPHLEEIVIEGKWEFKNFLSQSYEGGKEFPK